VRPRTGECVGLGVKHELVRDKKSKLSFRTNSLFILHVKTSPQAANTGSTGW
jgi:hypothetical protein